MSQKSIIILHVQKPEDIFFKSVILYSSKRLLVPTVEEFLIEEAEALGAGDDITLLVKSEERQPSREAEIKDTGKAKLAGRLAHCKVIFQ